MLNDDTILVLNIDECTNFLVIKGSNISLNNARLSFHIFKYPIFFIFHKKINFIVNKECDITRTDY